MPIDSNMEKAFSPTRLRYWVDAARGNTELGWKLHSRNTLVACILFADLQVLEVSLRNAFDRELKGEFGLDWPDHPEFKNVHEIKIAKSRARKMARGSVISHDKIIVNLQFSFWTKKLLDRKVYRDVVMRAFSGCDRGDIKRKLIRLVDLRDDVAHHEPIIDRDGKRRSEDLKTDLETLNEILHALDPVLARWLEKSSWIQPLVKSGFVSCDELKDHFVKIYVP
jgi:hypothetical protein